MEKLMLVLVTLVIIFICYGADISENLKKAWDGVTKPWKKKSQNAEEQGKDV